MSHYEELETLDPRGTAPAVRIEAPTPHKISVLLLVQIYLKVKKAAASAGLVYPAQSRRNFCMLLLKLIQYPDMTYNDLHQLLTSSRYKTEALHLDSFEKSMAELFQAGVDGLLDFAEFQNIERMLAEEMGVSQNSVVGLYIRRVGVIIERMSFAEMLALYKNMCLYYEKGEQCLASGTRRKLSVGISIERSCTPEEEELTNSTEDTEFEHEKDFECEAEESALYTDFALLNRNSHCKWSPRQADLFVSQQCDLIEFSELRALQPIELEKKLTEIINDNPLSTAAYFLAYMNQVRLRDYFGARKAIHRAFDRSPTYMMSQSDQKGFQYFCVNLAVLHSVFGHRKEGLAALRESVMLSQEIGDKRCLDLANSWYCQLNSCHVEPLEKCLPEILEPGEVAPLSLAIQFVVKQGALCGFLPLDIFELLTKSEEVNNKNVLLAYLPDLLAMRSALWCFYGRNELSSVFAQMLLFLKKTWAFGDIGNSETVAKTLSSTALWVNLQGEHQLGAILMQHAKYRFPRYPNATNWTIAESLNHIQQRIQHKSWYEAQCACCRLYLHDKKAANLQRAAVFLAKRHFSMARHILLNLLKLEDLDLLTQVRALILLAHTTMGRSSFNCAAAPLLMQASTVSSASCMEYEVGLIDMTLAYILLSMDMAAKAFQAVTNSIEKINVNGGLYDRAKTDFLFVRALVAAAQGDNIEKLRRLRRNLQLLERAMDAYRKLEAHAKVLDILVFLSQTFHELKERHERNKYAARFKQYYLDYPTTREHFGMPF